VIIPPVLDPVYNRDHNVAVTELPHPDFDALGVRVGSFVVHPSVTVGANYSTNVYEDDRNRRGDAFLGVAPFLTVDSDWATNHVGLVGAGDLRRYSRLTLRDQNAWYIFTDGELEVHHDLTVRADAQIDRSYETPYEEDVANNLTVPSTYLRKFSALRATYDPGRSRITLAADISGYTFSTIRFADGRTRDQRYRNRSIDRASAEYDYALSPSISLYGQLIGDVTNYSLPIAFDIPNRDSSGFAVIGGTNFDLAGVARGSLGIGYSRRDYKSSFYPTAQGVSVQAKVEFFPSELTTFNVLIQRQLQDVSLGNSGALWNNSVTVGIDHELFANLIVSGNAQYVRRQYVEEDLSTDVLQVHGEARYQASRGLGFTAGLSYGRARPSDVALGNPFNEVSGSLAVRLRA
jgi:hypothetical protein